MASPGDEGTPLFPQFARLPAELQVEIWRHAVMPGPAIHFLPLLPLNDIRYEDANWKSRSKPDPRSAAHVRSSLLSTCLVSRYETVRIWRRFSSPVLKPSKRLRRRHLQSALSMFDASRDVACHAFDGADKDREIYMASLRVWVSPFREVARHAAILWRWDWGRTGSTSFYCVKCCREGTGCLLSCFSKSLCAGSVAKFALRFRMLERFSIIIDEPHFPLADLPVVLPSQRAGELPEPSLSARSRSPALFDAADGVFYELLDTESPASRARFETPLDFLAQVQSDFRDIGHSGSRSSEDREQVVFRLLVRRDPSP